MEVGILRLDLTNGQSRSMIDFVAEEKPFHIFVNRIFHATILCSPTSLKELATGHLVTEGIAKSHKEIEDIKLSKNICRVRLISGIDVRRRLTLSRHLKRVILSACGVEGPYTPPRRILKLKSELTLDAKTISNCVRQLSTKATVFRKTGGVHAAAIFLKNGELVAFAEDVGRHNAVDKTIGMAIIDKIDLSSCFLALTGRLTADIVLKAVHVGLPIVASIAAALDSGIAIAKQADLTLVGFVRGRRMNVYTCPGRISL